MHDTTSIYEEFFGTKEGECHSFSFFRRPIRNIEPLRCIDIPDIYRYIVRPYAKQQTETLRSITDKTMHGNTKQRTLISAHSLAYSAHATRMTSCCILNYCV